MAPDSTQQASPAELKRRELDDARFRIGIYLAARDGMDAIDEIHIINQSGVNVILRASDLETVLEALSE